MLGRDGIAGLVCLGLSVALLVMTRGLPQSALVPIGPGFYPKIVLSIMAALSVMLIAADAWSRRRGRDADTAPAVSADTRNYRLVTVTFAVFAVYVLLLPFLGFRVATLLFVAALQVALDRPHGWRRWAVVITAAIATVIVTYLAFEVYLSVLLPRGRWTGF